MVWENTVNQRSPGADLMSTFEQGYAQPVRMTHVVKIFRNKKLWKINVIILLLFVAVLCVISYYTISWFMAHLYHLHWFLLLCDNPSNPKCNKGSGRDILCKCSTGLNEFFWKSETVFIMLFSLFTSGIEQIRPPRLLSPVAGGSGKLLMWRNWSLVTMVLINLLEVSRVAQGPQPLRIKLATRDCLYKISQIFSKQNWDINTLIRQVTVFQFIWWNLYKARRRFF